tara:strand:- start:309 stop:893 length:585 start_codon:yes stop_codon:yes gene_type:complete
MIAIEINTKQLKELREATGRAKKNFTKELAASINAVSKKTKLQIGRDIRATVALKKDESEKSLSIRAKATEQSLTAIVTLRKTKRLGLRHFGARQDKSGVSYKIGKTGGRQKVMGAFQGPKPGVMKTSWKGNAFKRVGKERLPIVALKGVSAYGAYAKNELSGPQVKAIEDELAKQIERRIKLNVLRANGLIPK